MINAGGKNASHEITELKAETANYYYVPESMSAADGTSSINASTIKSADVYALYDALTAQYPDYITKTTLGNDSSGTLPIHKYVFSPEKYKNSMVLGANMHGPGAPGDPKDVAVTLYNLMEEICTNWTSSKALSKLRWDIKFHVIPVQNPWGFDNDSRLNANGVDINRNFDYKWTEYTHPDNYLGGKHYKGTAPFSENETQYIRDLLLSVPDTSAYIDFHAWMNTGVPFQYVYAGGLNSPLNGIGKNITKYLGEKYNVGRTIEDFYTNAPQGFLYAYHVLGIPSCNPEHVVFSSDFPIRSSDAMTRMLEWYGNMVYATALYSEPDRYKGALVQLNPTSTTSITESVNTKITKFSVIHDTDGFYNSSTGEIVIPAGVKVVNLSGQVYLITTSTTPQTVTVTLLIRKNGGRYSGYAVSKQTVSLGGATNDLKEICINGFSLSVPVVAGEKYTLEVSQVGGGTNISVNDNVREGTWFAVQSVK